MGEGGRGAPGPRVVGLWVGLSALGGGVGFALGLALAGVTPEALGRAASGAVLFAVYGGTVGVAQWLILRAFVGRAGRWVAVGFLVWAALGALGQVLASALAPPAGPIVAGALVGVFQALVLRGHVRWPGLWAAAGALGWALGWPVAGAAERVLTAAAVGEMAGYALLYAILTAVSSACTGLALVWLWDRE